jgi:hypothetical protein
MVMAAEKIGSPHWTISATVDRRSGINRQRFAAISPAD